MADDLQPGLFDSDPDMLAPAEPREEPAPGVARVRLPNRAQLELRPSDLDSLLPEGHRARVVWAWVEQANLSRMYAGVRAVEGGSGRTAIAPEVLFALWLYATLDGIGTARTLARLTQAHDAYHWICGGVQVNYRALSDFRSAHGEAFDGVLSGGVAALMAVSTVTLKRVAQDGVRIRASAGAASFRREETLEQCYGRGAGAGRRPQRQAEEDPERAPDANRRRASGRARAPGAH